MSTYTIELRFVLEDLAEAEHRSGLSKVADIIEAARPKIFNFDYPIFSDLHKKELETKILRHYYSYEIGAETVSLFRLWLEERMCEIMPRYNKMFEYEAENVRLYDTFDYTREGHKTGNSQDQGSSKTSGTAETTTDYGLKTETDLNTSQTRTDNLTETQNYNETTNQQTTDTRSEKTKDKYSDTPQGGLTGVENDTYLTNARITEHTYEGGALDVTTTRSGSPTKTNTGTSTNANTGTNTVENSGEDVVTAETGSETETENIRTDNESYFERNRGYQGGKTYAEVLAAMKDALFDIDMLIINDLRDLFMEVF